MRVIARRRAGVAGQRRLGCGGSPHPNTYAKTESHKKRAKLGPGLGRDPGPSGIRIGFQQASHVLAMIVERAPGALDAAAQDPAGTTELGRLQRVRSARRGALFAGVLSAAGLIAVLVLHDRRVVSDSVLGWTIGACSLWSVLLLPGLGLLRSRPTRRRL